VSEARLLEATGLSKSYNGVPALVEASIRVEKGEVRSLVGANGAGKSTLIKILAGAVRPNSGQIKVDGVAIEAGEPVRMLNAGIACIYQHSNLAPAMSVLDNIYLGRQPAGRWGILDRGRQRADALALVERYGIDLDLDAAASDLPTVKQKEVEIAKALAFNSKIILMDEPTAWLSHSEVSRLFQTIRTLKANGVGIIYISHILDEVYEICDSVTVLRDGRIVADCPIGEIARQELLQKFIGDKLAQAVRLASAQERHPRGVGAPLLICRDLGRDNIFDGVSFELFGGEIFCITGLIGAKRTEFVRTLFGADKFDSGEMTLAGADYRPSSPRDGVARHIGFVPEDRRRDGLMLNMTIEQNLVMASLRSVTDYGVLSPRKMRCVADDYIGALKILPVDRRVEVAKLSGGNQQKVLIGKWLQTKPDILILDEPTVGVDVGAKAEIYGILRQLKAAGRAILVVSSDMEEVVALADRVMVMRNGRMQGVYDADKISSQEILTHVGGE
jgi:ABC-type sugar transport system ATPase subunit